MWYFGEDFGIEKGFGQWENQGNLYEVWSLVNSDGNVTLTLGKLGLDVWKLWVLFL